jgi:hypothetical protein
MERQILVVMLKEAAVKHHERLERTKADSLRWVAHPDRPWNGVVLSAATRGGSARWERNVAPRYEAELFWTVLDGLSAGARRLRFESVGRFWRRTADWLEAVYRHICGNGGPTVIRAALATLDAEAVISFWKTFPDVGDKYARNIMMDIYDSRFRDGRFAVDSRIMSLLPDLGYQGRNRYSDQEAFLTALAYEVGIEGWELDRLLYTSTNHNCGGAPLMGAPAHDELCPKTGHGHCGWMPAFCGIHSGTVGLLPAIARYDCGQARHL